MWEGPDLSSLGAIAVYAVLWGFIFAESALLLGFFLPGDTILFGAGLVAGSPNSDVNIVVLVVGAFLAAVLGNEVAYTTGRRYGRSWVESREKGRAKEQLLRAEAFYDKYGWLSVVIARWIPWVRTFLPIIAGTAAMDRRAFTSANIVGALPWAVGLPLLGYYAYQVPLLRDLAYVAAAIAIGGFFVTLLVAAVRRRRAGADASPGDEVSVTADADDEAPITAGTGTPAGGETQGDRTPADAQPADDRDPSA